MKITEPVLNKIEDVFGFPLYPWQKDFILGKINVRAGGRNNGKTFAYCIRILLEDGECINISDIRHGMHIDEWHGQRYVEWFTNYIRDINSVLVKNGFETRLTLER